MRNPFKSYWYISVERYDGSHVCSKHWRLFSTHRWANPSDVMRGELKHFAELTGTDDIVVTGFSRV